MLIKRNLLESLTFISCLGTVICILLNYVTNISPLTGIWFPTYVLVVFFAFATFSFRLIRWLMDLNKPLKYDVDGFAKNYPYLSFLCDFLPRVPEVVAKECKEYDINDLSVISTVLERRLVSSWYFPYISQEIGFPFACKQLLDQMIGKTFQICHNIDAKDVYIDTCSVLITHLKEYKKALIRQEKNPEKSIESLYKKSHQVSNGDKKTLSGEHCADLLRIILKELVPWELWDTPQLELLVRILAKKLESFIETTLTDPVWINDKLMSLLENKTTEAKEKTTEVETTEVLEAETKQEVTIVESKDNDETKAESMPPANSEMTTVESTSSSIVSKTTTPILQRVLEEVSNEEEKTDQVEEVTSASEPLDIKSSPVLRQRRGRQGRNEVKIYDRIIEGSVKTWETDTDLQCISLGQDLLASLNGEITLSRLWGQDQDTEHPHKDNRLWFGEDDALDMELGSKETSPVKKEHSPKPTDALLKDIQSTVHQAKSKIGDLQVPHVVSVNDEAAGMMEGLLDFGIAGFKKGLKFTGLSDDSQEKSPFYKDKVSEKSPPPDSKLRHEQKDVNLTAALREENGVSNAPHLVKQHRVSSQDSVATLPKPILGSEFPSSLETVSSSPEPEYEEAADLSTSIAKLRCLLQQRAHTNSNNDTNDHRSEDMWWEGGVAVETRAHHHQGQRTPRHVDSAVMADEYDMQADRLMTSPEQTVNNMQRLDKLFHRTVTGVFNSLKTAVGGDEMTAAHHANWTYIHTAMEGSVCARVTRLVCARRGGRVDAALDSLTQLNAEPVPVKTLEPADFEEWCSISTGAWCAGSELAVAAGLARAHLAYRIATLILAELAESLIDVYLNCMCEWIRNQIFSMFSNMAHQDSMHAHHHQLRTFNEEETCAAIMDTIPCIQIFGEETVTSAVHLTVTSFKHQSVNRDIVYRLLDLYTLHFKKAAGVKNPSFDTN